MKPWFFHIVSFLLAISRKCIRNCILQLIFFTKKGKIHSSCFFCVLWRQAFCNFSNFNLKFFLFAGLNSLEMKLLSVLMKKFNTENVDIFDKLPASLIAFRRALQLGNVSIDSDSSIQHQCIAQVSVASCCTRSSFIGQKQLKVAFVTPRRTCVFE